MQNEAGSTAVGCSVCGKKDLSLRCIEFQRAQVKIVEGVDSVARPLCKGHRFTRGVGYAFRALFLDLFNAGMISMLGIALENFRGGRVVPGDTSALMEQLASEFAHEGKREEEEKARALSARYRRKMDEELATIERIQRDQERRLGL